MSCARLKRCGLRFQRAEFGAPESHMKSFVITSVCFAVVRVIALLIVLGAGKYPRAFSNSPDADAVKCAFAVIWLGWGVWLLSR